MPPTLADALAAFQNGALAQKAFGTAVVEHCTRRLLDGLGPLSV
ncbi:hypothetical protein ACFSL4_17305 [Streptomyces caeni]|uniref:Uncharacterized protein n=1 Tax=Streptomyces caeni TaxID=2307231 RepID=A0ABW4IVB1_9ACTN